MVSSLIASGKCAVLVSEERDDAVIVPEGTQHGNYCVVFDPLDGSRSVPHPPTATEGERCGGVGRPSEGKQGADVRLCRIYVHAVTSMRV